MKGIETVPTDITNKTKNNGTTSYESRNSEMLTIRIPRITIAKRINGWEPASLSNTVIMTTLEATKCEPLRKRKEPSIVAIEDQFQTTDSRNANLAHTNGKRK